ncbi:efflux RND transporter periplasmic adaptor subunit [Pedobacter sp. HMWF019]|uniref:efflux RND transporter periplasmic adaptor subunit n=1 Tax=Pedobacter sp. HMWF019 TaxID=2056856 RepID=UPI000D377E93|nr:efflux RND transporter periplasmic adaptor subunit [Pedobacter sp. HMWF019]PTS99815.1 efflux RND transporter periplasmic adaptor subunit [Pedobacter sp. HMWF019]
MKQNQYKLYRTQGLMLALLFVLSACHQEKSNVPHGTTNKKNEVQVSVVHPVLDQPYFSLELPGELKAYEEVVLYPKVKGFVKKIMVDRGAKVTKGQLLVVLEAPEIIQQYMSAKSDEQKFQEDYIYSRQSYERLKKAALKSGAVAEIELDRAKSKLKKDSAAFISVKAKTNASAQLQQYLKITAPFDGVVTEKNVSAGALVGDGSQVALLTIAQTQKLRLTVAIPEKHAQSIYNGIKVSFTVKNYPGKTFSSNFSRKSSVLDQKSRAVVTEFDVQNQSGILGGGEYAQVKLNMRRPSSTLWLPASSIVTAQSGVFVLKVENGLAESVPVSLGIRKGELQEVFGDINPQDHVVKVGSEELTPKTKLLIK